MTFVFIFSKQKQIEKEVKLYRRHLQLHQDILTTVKPQNTHNLLLKIDINTLLFLFYYNFIKLNKISSTYNHKISYHYCFKLIDSKIYSNI
jgi:hypothetical protein